MSKDFWWQYGLNFKGHEFAPIEDLSTTCRNCGLKVLVISHPDSIKVCCSPRKERVWPPQE